MSKSVIDNDIIDSLLRFTNKKVRLNSIKSYISGIHNGFLNFAYFYRCQYKLEGSSSINIIHIDLYYKNEKLHRDDGGPAIIIRTNYTDNYYGEIWISGNLKKIIKWNKSL